MTFNPNKPYRRRDGGEVRIICTDARSEYPIIALHEYYNREVYMTHDLYGFLITGEIHDEDLINVPEELEAHFTSGRLTGASVESIPDGTYKLVKVEE